MGERWGEEVQRREKGGLDPHPPHGRTLPLPPAPLEQLWHSLTSGQAPAFTLGSDLSGWPAGRATGWTLLVVTIFSLSRPLLSAELRLALCCCFFSLEPSCTALRGFTGWGLQGGNKGGQSAPPAAPSPWACAGWHHPVQPEPCAAPSSPALRTASRAGQSPWSCSHPARR